MKTKSFGLVLVVVLGVLSLVITSLLPPVTTSAMSAESDKEELKIALSHIGGENMDPSMGGVRCRYILDAVYDRLVGHTSEGELSKEKGIAADWQISSDYTRYAFKLRPGIEFSNGEKLTSADVKFSLEHFMRPRSVSSFCGVLRKNIKSIETPDPLTVVVNTKKGYRFLAWDLSGVWGNEGMVLPKEYIKEKGEDFFSTRPLGSGPYTLKEHKVGSYVLLEARPDHWRIGKPKYQKIRIMLVPEQGTRIAMLKTGEADVVDISRRQVPQLMDKFPIFQKKGAEVVFLWFNNPWEGYLNDIRVRKALNLAINRKALKDTIFYGRATVSGACWYGSWAIGYQPLEPYPYDLAKAKQLLAEAYPKGIELDFYTYERPGVPEVRDATQAIAAIWREIGVKTNILPVEYGTYRGKLQRKDLRNSVSLMAVSNMPNSVPLYRLIGPDGVLQTIREPEFEKLVALAEKAADVAEFGERQWQVAKFIHDNYYQGALLEAGDQFAANPKMVKEWNLGRCSFDLNIRNLYSAD